ncbi:MAG: 1-acyl-sn-glycerol-3-phosphate acyltransferase [Myxococcaceae bacterium]|nr:1-acyl-sn-glycerol-3-phosphate acyltransferase [Myxococcaceae bacterium]
MFYRLVRAVIGFALRLFYILQVTRKTEDLGGPVLYVGNHPNSLLDPALVFAATDRQVTFLAKEPLFRMPLFGAVLRGLGALPVYRKQDHPGQMAKNEGTLEAAASALIAGKAITIFPEGKSHSDPQLSEIKTGCARIALRAARGGAPVRIVPIGLTYAQKHRFRSKVQIEVGAPIELVVPADLAGEQEAEWVRALTGQVADGLKAVTLNLEQWEDLKLIETGEQLYSLRVGEKTRDPERLRRFAKGVELLRKEQPERFELLRDEVVSFRARLEMVNADPKDLSMQYRRPEVARFVLRNLSSLLFGFPLFAIGCVLFAIPFLTVRYAARLLPLPRDRIATFKFISALILTPLWQTLLAYLAWRAWGPIGAGIALAGALPLAFFTRYFLERRRAAIADVVTFFVLGSRSRLKARLLVDGEALAAQIEKTVTELRPRVVGDSLPPPDVRSA